MARPKRIDRDTALEAANSLITEIGGIHFTMDMVAARAGISKGGLTYSYPTKDALIVDMLRREIARFVSERKEAEKGTGPQHRLEAHIEASASQGRYLSRAAHLMAAIANKAHHREIVQAFYREVFDLADPETEEGRRARHAFLAAEGAFLLRGLGLMKMSDEEWTSIYDYALKQLRGAGS